MKFAMILNGVVDNIILSDETTAYLIRDYYGYQYAIDVTNRPCNIGWLYDGENFIPQ